MEGECTFFLAASTAGTSAPAGVLSALSASVGALILGTLRAGPPACSARAALRLDPADWVPPLLSPDAWQSSE